MLPLRVRVDIGTMVMKGFQNFSRHLQYLNLTITLFNAIEGHSLGKFYSAAEIKSAYSTAHGFAVVGSIKLY